MNGVSVFLSSTSLDLKPEREAVERVLRHMKRIRFIGMEYFGARDASARVASLSEVDSSDVYLGILGSRYGSGITEAEYRRAQERGIPCLFYVKVPEQEAPPSCADDAVRLATFRKEVQARHIVVMFHTAQELPARVAADLHNLIFDQVLVQGIGKLQAGYDSRIRRFVGEYLGDAQHPIAFGGRDRELMALDRWFDDEHAPPYALLAGAAGRGKSALLVRWAERLVCRDDLDLIFFPISIRFRTNLATVTFASIAARLAALHGDAVPGAADTPAEVWRELVSSYLERVIPVGRRFLLIIDGADESADSSIGPDLFPLTPPARLKILVSARLLAGDVDPTGWLGRLGWSDPRRARSLQLQPLTPDGLVQALKTMSVPLEILSGKSDVVAELYRLSEGDPLLVNLYAADLWSRGEQAARLQPSDLAQIKPGLDGYFERWREDQRNLWGAKSPQREPAYNDVFNVLACALGPLLTSQVLELLPPERPLDVWALEDVLEDLKRFVIGDGDAQGYTFSHPRLGDYFYELLQRAGRAEVHEARFVSWGMRCTRMLEDQGAAYQVPTYVLQFLRRHMDRARCDAKAFRVLSSTLWARAWERLDRGSHTGFLGDLSVVHQIVAQESKKLAAAGVVSPFTATELRCALCHSSIVTLAGDLSVPVLAAVVAKGIWSPAQAIAYATNIPQRRSRLEALLELATVVDETHLPLAVAAALTESRALCATDDGRKVLREVIAQTGTGLDATKSPCRLVRKADALSRIVRQLPSPHNLWLVPRVPASEAARLQSELTAVGPKVEETLEVLLAVAFASPEHRSRALELVLGLLPYLAATSWSRTAEQMARLLSAQMVTPLVAAAKHLPFKTYVDVLVHLISCAPEESGARIKQALTEAFARRTPAAPALLSALRQAGRWLPCEVLLDSLYRAAAFLRPAEQVMLYDRLGAEREEPDVAVEMAARALAALELPLDRPEAAAALAALVDLILPEGAGDSLESWRYDLPDPSLYRALRRVLTAGTAVPGGLRAVGVAIERSRGRYRVVARAIAKSLAGVLTDEQGRLPPSIRRALQVRHAIELNENPASLDPTARAAPNAAQAKVASEIAARVLARYDSGTQPAEKLAEVVLGLGSPAQLPQLLPLFAELCAWLPPETIRSALAVVLQQGDGNEIAAHLEPILSLIAAEPLAPPSSELLSLIGPLADLAVQRDAAGTVAMFTRVAVPDEVRLELLAGALRVLRFDDPLVYSTEREICRLTVHSDAVLRSIVHRFGKEPATEVPDLLAEVLCRLKLTSFLSLTRQLSPYARRKWLVRLPDYQSVSASRVWGQLIAAIQASRSDRDKVMWLIDVTESLVPVPTADLLTVATTVREDTQRLLALAAIIPRLPVSDRHATLVEALRLARRRGTDPRIARGLIQCAIDLGAAPELAREAIEVVLTLSDRGLRANALAELGPSLSPAMLSESIAAFRRIDDSVNRVRAMKALTAVVADASHRQSAIARTLASIAKLPPGERRACAAVYISPLLPAAERWSVLEEALSQREEEASGFTFEELLESLSQALRGAPAKIFVLSLAWIRRVPSTAARARALAELMPFMPEGLLPLAFVRLAESAGFPGSNAGRSSLEQAFRFFPVAMTQRLVRQRARLSMDAKRLLEDLESRQAAGRVSLLLPPPESRDIEQLWRYHANMGLTEALQIRSALAHGPRAQDIPFLVGAVANIRDAELRWGTTCYLGLHYSQHQLEQAVRLAARIESPADRCAVQLRLVSSLSGIERAHLVDAALASAQQEEAAFAKAFVAAEVAAAAPDKLPAALDVLYASGDLSAQVGALQELIPRLDDQAAANVVRTLHRLNDGWARDRLLLTVAPKLGRDAAVAAFGGASSESPTVVRSRVIAALIPRLPDDLRDPAEQALEVVEIDFAWLEMLAATVERWPPTLTVARARSAASHITALVADDCMAEWLMRMVPYWPAVAWLEFIAAAGQIELPSARADVLNALLRSRDSADVPDEIATAIDTLSDEFCRSVCGGHLAIRRGDDVLVADALQRAARCGDAGARIDALVSMATLAESVPDVLLFELLLGWPGEAGAVVAAVTEVACLLTPEQALRVLARLQKNARGLNSDLSTQLLFALARRVPDEHIVQLLECAEQLCTERQLTGLLIDLADILDGEKGVPAALGCAEKMKSATFRADVMCGLFSRLHDTGRKQVRASLQRIADRTDRKRRLLSVGLAIDGADDCATEEVTDVPSAAETRALLQSLLDEAMANTSESSTESAERLYVSLESRAASTLSAQLRSLECETDRYLAISQRLSSLPVAELAALVLELPQQVTPMHAAQLLGKMLPLLPDSQRQPAVTSALGLADPAARKVSLQLAMRHASDSWKPVLHEHWRAMLGQASRGNRDQFFSSLETVAPVLAALGGDAGVVEAIDAIDEIGRSWP
jgi:hypothetical protein